MVIYYVFLGVWLLAFLIIYNNIRIERMPEIDSNKFESKFYNKLYQLSFSIPFVWFCDDDDNLTSKGRELDRNLEMANYKKKYTVRSFMTFKVVIFIICGAMSIATILIMKNASLLSKLLLNIQTTSSELSAKNIFTVVVFWMILALMPNLMLKQKVKKALVENNKDIPILQMFIILMLRANKTVPDILYSLSKLNTVHKEHFEQGYRIYLRNKQEGIEYLKSKFLESRFVETFGLLEDISEFAREDCIRILESNQKNIIDEIAMIKRRNDMTRLVYTQASMIAPFMVVILLGAIPIIMAGISAFANSGFSLSLPK